MTPEQYAAQQAVISAAIANYTLALGRFFTQPLLTLADWIGLLELLFPQIVQRRRESAELARVFYDSQRELHRPDLPRNDQFLMETDFGTFVQNMDPVRQRISLESAPEDAVAALALRAVREVENAGRRQIIRAVEEDPETRILRGWARVATGRETCAWCLMLISRGPTYLGSDTAGFQGDDEDALAAFERASDLKTYFADIGDDMEEWHDGCDCKVVPVFKRQDWPGRGASERALKLWKEADKAARLLRKEDPSPPRVHPSGKNKGKPFTLNEDIINVLRRKLASGEITPSEWAALAAA